jgi:hypothetical protein
VLLATAVVGIVVTVWTQGVRSVYAVGQPLERPVLEHRARTLLDGSAADGNRYGYSYFAPSDRAFELRDESRSESEWRQIGSSRPGLTEFLYLSSPRPLSSGSLLGVMPRTSAPLEGAGTARIRLDGQGRLIEFTIVPEPLLAEVGSEDPDFTHWFEESGLEAERFVATAATEAPPFYAEKLFSWAGTYPASPGLDPSRLVRVDAAANGDRVLFWRMVDTQSDLAAGDVTPGSVWIALVMALVMLGLGGFWAWRNHLSGRGDHRGATVVAVAMAGAILWSSFVSSLPMLLASFSALFARLGLVSLLSLIAWLSYMAIEPSLRRLTPRSQVSWSRLLAGRVRDPLLGRDFLLGLSLVSLTYALQGIAAVWLSPGGFKLQLFYPHGEAPLLGTAVSVANLLHFTNVLVPLGLMFLIVLPRIVLKGPRLETAATWLGYLLLLIFAISWNGLVGGIIQGSVLILLARTGGLVALFGFAFAVPQLYLLPTSVDSSLWWAPNSWIGPGFLILLALGAFRLATRPQVAVELIGG